MDKRAPLHLTSPITTPAKVARPPMQSTAPHSSVAMARPISNNPLRSKILRRGLKVTKRQPQPPLTIIANFVPMSPAPRPAHARPRSSSISRAPAPVSPALPTRPPIPIQFVPARQASSAPPSGAHWTCARTTPAKAPAATAPSYDNCTRRIHEAEPRPEP